LAQRYALLSLIVLLPGTALANAGTSMIMFRAFHLVIGNALIGIGEGLLLALLLRRSLLRTIPVMIVANYASAHAGLYALKFLTERIPFTLDNTQQWVSALILFTFLLTLLVEAPIFIALMWGRWGQSRWAIGGGFLAVQALSYGVMFALYGAVSPQSLFRDHEWVPLAAMDIPANVRMYYINADDGDAYASNPIGSNEVKVADLNCATVEDRILVWPSQAEAGSFDLVLQRWEMQEKEVELVKPNVATTVAWVDPRGNPPSIRIRTNSRNYGQVPQLGDGEHQEWEWTVDYWAGVGLHGYHKQDRATIRYAYETPFVEWVIRNATHLPGNLLLFQVGHEDILIADPARRLIARVCKGRSPVAVIAE